MPSTDRNILEDLKSHIVEALLLADMLGKTAIAIDLSAALEKLRPSDGEAAEHDD